MVQHVLLSVNIHFHWNLFIFEFLTIFLIFILATILKILKTKSTTLSDDLFLCQVSKGSAVWSEFNIFCTLVTMATAAILNLFNPSKAATYYGGYSYKVWWSLMKGIKIFFKSPFFYFHGNCGKVCPTDCEFFWLISFSYMWMSQETLLQNFMKFVVNNKFFAPWLPWQRPPF
jgi:hypothetical protein